MKPGQTISPWTSSVRSDVTLFFDAWPRNTMRSPRIPTSSERGADPLPSTTCPPRRRRSRCSGEALARTWDRKRLPQTQVKMRAPRKAYLRIRFSAAGWGKLLRAYWFFSSARTRASSEIGSASPCPRQVYTFTCWPPTFVEGTPVDWSRFRQKMPLWFFANFGELNQATSLRLGNRTMTLLPFTFPPFSTDWTSTAASCQSGSCSVTREGAPDFGFGTFHL